VNFEWHRLERPRLDDIDDWVIGQYREMYEAYFEERGIIPAGRHSEVRFEDIEANPIGELRRIYEALSLPDFSEVEPAIKDYVASLAGYKKNAFPEIAADLRSRIAREWSRCFEEWGYPK